MRVMGEPTKRLGQLVRQRREQLGFYTVVDAARHAGISRETWTSVERGDPAKPVTYRKIEAALEWAAGSVAAVLADGEPIALNAEEFPNSIERDELEDLRRALTAALEWLDRLQQKAP